MPMARRGHWRLPHYLLFFAILSRISLPGGEDAPQEYVANIVMLFTDTAPFLDYIFISLA